MTRTLRRGLVAVIALLALVQAPLGAQTGSAAPTAGILSPALFRDPGRGPGVHAWWHWLDGAITREGITKDLEALAAQGVVQATILNVGLFDGRDFGVPRVAFASPEWFSMFRWALAEADRLGITIGVHNCDGWSSSGGPWITPELSMKQVAWTKTLVDGGRSLDLRLPRPAAIEGFYRDVAVVAFRTTQRPSAFQAARPRLQVNDAEVALEPLVDGCPVSALRIQKGDRLVFSAAEPLAFDRVALHVRRPFMWDDPARFETRFAVETSADGRDWRPLTDLEVKGLNRTAVLDVPHSSAPFVRIVVRGVAESDTFMPLELGELEVLGMDESPAWSPAIPYVVEKTSAVKAATDEDVFVQAPDGTPAVAPGDVRLLTERMDADGRLRWEAPSGSWAILRFGYTSTGATNAPATAEGRGLECDKMDPTAVEHHFRSFPERLIREAGDHAGKTFRFVFVDSWEAGFQNWTARFPAEFERRRGYSLLPWLPVLAGEAVSSARESEAVLYDFRRTIADLIRESYYERLAALIHERGLEFHAEVIYGGAGYPPLDVLRSTKPVDLPMTEFWTSANRDSLLEYTPVERPEMNLPACAVAGYGKRLLGSEAYTGFAHYSESPADLKPFGDAAYTSGINRMILHSSVHQPTDDKPGMTLGQFASHFNRNNLYWSYASPWLTYQARIQSVLGEGAPVFDVLYFLGDQLPQSYGANASTAVPTGYAVDAVDAEILNERISVAGGRLQLNGGEAGLLSLPPQPFLSLDTLKRIEALVGAGAHLYGPRPLHTLSLADASRGEEFGALASRVWGEVDGKTVFSRRYGNGSVSWGRPLGQVLAEVGVAPQFAATPAGEKEFLFVHRRVAGQDAFFVVNQQDRVLARECSFRVGEATPEIWDPETGAITRPAAFRIEGAHLRLPVRFRPRQALLFVFRPGRPARFVTSVHQAGAKLFPAPAGAEVAVPEVRFEGNGLAVVPATSGELTLGTSDGRTLSGRFDAPERLPIVGLRGTLELRGPGVASRDPIEISELRSLTEFDAKEVRYFSGEATYRLRFGVPAAAAVGGGALQLDLGDFESVADVTLNGHPLGRLWRPGVGLDVTSSLRRDNELVVTVANVYRNRLIGDLAEFGEIRNLRTSSPIRQFLAPDKPLKRSGLIGPLQLTRVRAQRVPGF
jgi:(4-O-methyl)-D-glucuronate---lignin esterase